METRIVAENEKGAWEKYVRQHSGSIAWQSYDWFTVVRKHYAVDFIPLAVMNGSGITGVLPLYRIGSSQGKNMLISVPYAVAGGILADNEDADAALVGKAIALAAEYGSRGITLKQYKRKIAGSFRIDDGFYNRELDISRDLTMVWNGLDDRNKQKIDEAQKYPLVLDYPTRDMNAFYKLLFRHHHRNGVPCVSKKWIEDLIAFKLYTAALLTLNGRPVAGTLVKEFKDTVSFPFSCIASADEQHYMYAYDLYWKLISRFAARGTRIYHSGRIPHNNDVEEYRLGWNGTQYGYYYQYYPAGDAIRQESNKKGRKRELFASLWRQVPESIAARLGPSIVKRFP